MLFKRIIAAILLVVCLVGMLPTSGRAVEWWASASLVLSFTVKKGESRAVWFTIPNATDGYVIMRINRDGSFEPLPNTIVTELGVSAVITEGCTLTYFDNSKSFTDIDKDFWAKGAIDYMSAREFLMGKRDGSFGPTETITRKTVALLLYRIEGEPEVSGGSVFSDVKEDIYHDAILWASQVGVVNGYSDGTFRPDGIISRQHFAAMLYRYSQYRGYKLAKEDGKDITVCPDYGSIYGWAKECTQWAYQLGLINGRKDGSFDPQGNTTRAQLAVIMSRFLQKFYVAVKEQSAHKHSWGEWEMVAQATVESEGELRRVCYECGDIETQATPKLEAPVTPPVTDPGENTTGLDYAAATIHGNQYAQQEYSWVLDGSLNEDNAGGFFPVVSYTTDEIAEKGGQQFLYKGIVSQLWTTHYYLSVQNGGVSGIYRVNCRVWEEDGRVHFAVYYKKV